MSKSRGLRSRLKPNFWDNTQPAPPSECVLWMAGASKHGYGQLWDGNRVEYAHRRAWELTNGRSVPEGLHVLHHCDVPTCVNPRHLYVGTHQQNLSDIKARYRNPGKKGQLSPCAKLTKDAVEDIRANYRPVVVPYKHFAKKYGISNRHVCAVVRGECWK